MNDLKIKLKLLDDILKDKRAALETILNICENEETVINSGEGGVSEMLKEMAKEKSVQIQSVQESDSMFETTYAGIRYIIEDEALNWKPELKKIQGLITEVSGLDLKIRAKEDMNRHTLAQKKQQRGVVPRRQVANLYKSSKDYRSDRQ